MLSLAVTSLNNALAVIEAFGQSELPLVEQAAGLIAKAFTQEKKLVVFGNGGSAADAQHLAAELVNRFQFDRPPLPALALTTDTSLVTSIANDFSFDEIFAKQIKGLCAKGDICLAISTSGRSANVVKGLVAARAKGMVTLGLTGRDGGDMASLCDLVIRVPSDDTPRIQEVHALVIHLICELVDYTLFGRAK
ncbi:MAG: D-sedoheptulose-7-phosphate isomerase [Thermodesulfobacteriota bacterium]